MTSTLDLINTLSLDCQQVNNKTSSVVRTDYTVPFISCMTYDVFIRLRNVLNCVDYIRLISYWE